MPLGVMTKASVLERQPMIAALSAATSRKQLAPILHLNRGEPEATLTSYALLLCNPEAFSKIKVPDTKLVKS